MRVVNATRNTVLADRCALARSFWQRWIGLLGRRALAEGEGLWMDRCAAIHTFGMRFALDVVWLNEQRQVLQLVASLLPGRISVCRRATAVLELPEGTIYRTRTALGDHVQIADAPESQNDATILGACGPL